MISQRFSVKDLSYTFFIFVCCMLLEMKLGKVANFRIELLMYLFLVSCYLMAFFFRHKLKLYIKFDYIGWAGCVYLLMLFTSSIWSVSPVSSFQYASIFFIGLLGISTRKNKDFFGIVQNLLFFLLVLSVLSWLYYFMFGSLALSHKDVAWRLKGILGHEQRLAVFMSIGLVLLVLERLKTGKRYPIYYYLFFIATLFATQARANIVFTLVVVGLIYMIEGKKHVKLIFFSLTMLIAITLAGSFDLITERFSRGDADLTLTGRVPIWEYTLFRVEERPNLGYGFASFMKEGISTQIFRDYIPPHAHSTIVHSLFEVGMIGTILLLFWMYKLTTFKTPTGKSYGFYLIVLVFLCGLTGIIFGTKLNGCLLLVLFLISVENDLKFKRNN